MPKKKIKKRKKNSRMRGTGTHGGGARKKRKKSGHRGGSGMSGSGKRADNKKTLINKKYGHDYFGKRGLTSRKSEKDKRKRINLRDIFLDLESYLKSGKAKKSGQKIEINLKKYKILGKGDIGKFKIKEKLLIKAYDASKSAKEKVSKIGGEIILEKEENKKEIKKEGKNKKPKTLENKEEKLENKEGE